MYFYSNNLIGYISKPLFYRFRHFTMAICACSVSAFWVYPLNGIRKRLGCFLLLFFYLTLILAEDKVSFGVDPIFCHPRRAVLGGGISGCFPRWHESNAGSGWLPWQSLAFLPS